MTDDDADRAGRKIAGHTSYKQVMQDIRVGITVDVAPIPCRT
jgi:hypothetical protein